MIRKYFLVATLLVLALGLNAQLIKTSLTLTVRDELGNTVEGVAVKIYTTEANYTAEKNPVQEGLTDKKGVIKFKDLSTNALYIIARKGDKDNSGGGEQVKLENGKNNKATIVIQ